MTNQTEDKRKKDAERKRKERERLRKRGIVTFTTTIHEDKLPRLREILMALKDGLEIEIKEK